MYCDECLHSKVCSKKEKYKEKFNELNKDDDFKVELKCNYFLTVYNILNDNSNFHSIGSQISKRIECYAVESRLRNQGLI
ncbi:MAG: hypothetical protein ACFFDF_00435 [Candidatus Odinarchaeota archaeon]